MWTLRTCFVIAFALAIALPASAQKKCAGCSIEIKDNRGSNLVEYRFLLTPDSLTITGKTEREHPVNYTARTWAKAERKQVRTLFRTLELNDFETVYAGSFGNLKYISSENYPRIIQLELKMNGVVKQVKVTNVYALPVADLIHKVNGLLPAETRISYREEDFKRQPETNEK